MSATDPSATSDPSTQPATPRPSGAIVLLQSRAGGGVEVFMVRRHVQSEFVPDVFVFPGGSVKPSDRDAELAPGIAAPVGAGPTTLGSGLRAAALRECFEEAGVLLARRGNDLLAIPPEDAERFALYRRGLQQKTMTLGEVASAEHLTLATDALVHWAHWITPEAFPLRFDTHFFLAAMPPGQAATYDQMETTAGTWIRPEDALSGFEAGSFPLVFATIHQLRALVGLNDPESALAHVSGTVPRTIMPRIVPRDGGQVILMPDEE